MKLISVNVNFDQSWDIVVEVNGTNRSVTIPTSVTPVLTDSASVQAYLKNQFPVISVLSIRNTIAAEP